MVSHQLERVVLLLTDPPTNFSTSFSITITQTEQCWLYIGIEINMDVFFLLWNENLEILSFMDLISYVHDLLYKNGATTGCQDTFGLTRWSGTNMASLSSFHRFCNLNNLSFLTYLNWNTNSFLWFALSKPSKLFDDIAGLTYSAVGSCGGDMSGSIKLDRNIENVNIFKDISHACLTNKGQWLFAYFPWKWDDNETDFL